MATDSLDDAVLVILGHGSIKHADSSAPVLLHAAELRRRRIFAEVREAFWKQEPQVKQVLAGITAARIFIVPLFISEGYFSDQVIPRELGFGTHSTLTIQHGVASQRNQGGSTLFYCSPVGTHSSMTGILMARAGDIVEKFPFPHAPTKKEITLFIAGHGTEQYENSRAAIERQVELIRRMDLYAGVHSVYLEEEPRISACYEIAQTRHVVVVPFFLSDGMHTQEDIPILLGQPEELVKQRLAAGQPTWRNPTEMKGKLVWYSSAVGTEPHIADVILHRVREVSEGDKK